MDSDAQSTVEAASARALGPLELTSVLTLIRPRSARTRSRRDSSGLRRGRSR